LLGLAMKEPRTFFSWINWTTQFFGQLDLAPAAVTPLGDAGQTGAIYAMLYKEIDLGSRPLPVRSAPASFTLGGAVTSVWDPDGLLHRRVRPGHRFAGLLSYDAAAPYRVPDPNTAPPYGITLSIDGYRFSSSGLGAWVANNYFDALSSRSRMISISRRPPPPARKSPGRSSIPRPASSPATIGSRSISISPGGRRTSSPSRGTTPAASGRYTPSKERSIE